jgi:uncharacterized membrane protein
LVDRASSEINNRRAIKILLQSGLFLSTMLMFSGVFLSFYQGHSQILKLEMGQLFSPTTPLADRFLVWGIFTLALTPVLRVLALIVLWLRERDWKFVAISIFVFGALLYSILSEH